MDSKANSPVDQLSQQVAMIRRGLDQVIEQQRTYDKTILKILQTLKIGEEAFELRVARVLRNVLDGTVHDLDHKISETQANLEKLARGFDIFVVDGETVKENAQTMRVTKLDEAGQYLFARVNDPEGANHTEGTQQFIPFFEAHPELFADRKEILVNVIAYVTEVDEDVKPEVTDGQA